MSSFKNILKENIKMMVKTLIFLFSLVVIGVVAGVTFFLMVEKNSEPCDNQFIQGCMAAGLSEQSCKSKLY